MSVSGRRPATSENERDQDTGPRKALALMEQALAIIDAHGGPADAGAHLDLAIHRLREWLAESKPK
jgi:hypothetical protein